MIYSLYALQTLYTLYTLYQLHMQYVHYVHHVPYTHNGSKSIGKTKKTKNWRVLPQSIAKPSRKQNKNKKVFIDMGPHCPPLPWVLNNVFFLDGFAMLLVRGLCLFVFPRDLLSLCVGLCLVGTLQITTYITPEHVGWNCLPPPYISRSPKNQAGQSKPKPMCLEIRSPNVTSKRTRARDQKKQAGQAKPKPMCLEIRGPNVTSKRTRARDIRSDILKKPRKTQKTQKTQTFEEIWASGWAATGLGGGFHLLPKCLGFFVFLGFLGFPMDLLPLCVGLCLVGLLQIIT